MKKQLFAVLAVVALAILGVDANAQTALKVGYTDIDVLLAGHPKTKTVEAELNTRRTQYQNQIQTLQKEIQDKIGAYQKAENTMSDVIKADKQKELQGLQERYQTLGQSAETELAQKQQQLLQPILTEIDNAIKAVAKENQYTFILSSSISMQLNPVVLYADPATEVTDLVFKKMGIDPEALKKAAQQPAATTPATNPKPAAPKKN
ncbi:OmpH family outer membrane protein [Siphonobacter aquaeclarae]|jgi:outer membrane protein|uniref:Periplasmic chaperone for outer membrane proteins Skp n=1 Tax=Siphonobacter aquaeclarae TaxID=563176 RepID=A0A1G9XN22_9BACT|nr:OmpH family outer membrane protein [Siphonobacter aquaeclarae]MBO9638473.1 OmpH family outer membrane protein [Siphonobacter aquaeclarae]SDM98259.1 periplasmic chaperone for outer membrane proteins Skp [Siphonobacter aquaeclarae]